MIPSNRSKLALLIGAAFLMTACSGLKTTSSSGSGGTTGSFTIGGTVTGLTGTGLVLADNTTDTLTITPGKAGAAVPFTFTKSVTGAYSVAVKTQPSNPAQNCTVSAGAGTATANVTTVAVACTTNPVTATIGGTLSGLATGASVILQDNGGDALTLSANGSFTFKTPVTGPTDAYAVTVNTQPTTPNQICTVANGSGTAGGNVTNVAVTCVLSYTIGGTVTGVVGTGLTLENSSDSEQLPISAANGNQAFTFKNLVPTGTAYTISISAQPTNPVQTCVVTPSTASGTATANVTSVVITCPAVTYSVGGTVVGLAGVTALPPGGDGPNGSLTDNSFSLQNNLGNTKVVSSNGPFNFATPEALNDQYDVSIFTFPSTQTQGCTTWNFKGVVTANVTAILVDCAHNDWTWIDGTNTAGTIAAPGYGSFPTSLPATTPNPFTNTPGTRYGAAGWTDAAGNLWMFGGDGYELAGNPSPDTYIGAMNDLWVCQLNFGGYTLDYCQWQLVGAYGPSGPAIYLNAQFEQQPGVYGTLGGAGTPGGRWGAATWTDSTGNLWMFGGNGNGYGLFNDLWKFDTSSFTPSTYTTNAGQWTWQGGSKMSNQAGTYTGAPGSLAPGARVNATYWKDGSGKFWLFGGYGYDGNGNEGYLNDLWEYTGGNWVFVAGGTTYNQLGNYGTPGTPAGGNIPGGRHEAVGWTDAAGNLWLFGGEGEDSSGTPNGILDDLWMYNIANNQWTFVMGSDKANQTGVYESSPAVGPVNTTGAASTCGLVAMPPLPNCPAISTTGALPGSRWGASAWVDGSGDFWLFGGWGLDSTATNGNGALNDLWVYTPNATAGQPGQWVWIKGSNTGSDNGVYGTLARPYLTYVNWTPGGRSNATHWVDSLGQLWLFGGEGYDATSTTGNGYLNDLWRYLPYQD